MGSARVLWLRVVNDSSWIFWWAASLCSVVSALMQPGSSEGVLGWCTNASYDVFCNEGLCCTDSCAVRGGMQSSRKMVAFFSRITLQGYNSLLWVKTLDKRLPSIQLFIANVSLKCVHISWVVWSSQCCSVKVLADSGLVLFQRWLKSSYSCMSALCCGWNVHCLLKMCLGDVLWTPTHSDYW